MNIEIITSFNEHYYNLIGKDSVTTWLEHWPKNLKLTCYVEEFELPNQKRIVQIPFTELGQDYLDFQASNENDRVKIFAKKAYSVIHAMKNSTADRIIWIDADVITKEAITQEFLESLCPNDTLATFMGVQHHKVKGDPESEMVFSGETGFFVINKNHSDFVKFMVSYCDYYNQHKKENLRRFYDGDVFGAVVKSMPNTKFNDLAANIKKNAKTPLKHTELGKYIHHFKSKGSKDNYAQ